MPFERVTPRSLTPTSVRANAPPVSGVYGISNALRWIYIGESDNIRFSLLVHLRQGDPALTKRQPAGFVFEVCDAAVRPARHARLVAEYEPAWNQAP